MLALVDLPDELVALIAARAPARTAAALACVCRALHDALRRADAWRVRADELIARSDADDSGAARASARVMRAALDQTDSSCALTLHEYERVRRRVAECACGPSLVCAHMSEARCVMSVLLIDERFLVEATGSNVIVSDVQKLRAVEELYPQNVTGTKRDDAVGGDDDGDDDDGDDGDDDVAVTRHVTRVSAAGGESDEHEPLSSMMCNVSVRCGDRVYIGTDNGVVLEFAIDDWRCAGVHRVDQRGVYDIAFDEECRRTLVCGTGAMFELMDARVKRVGVVDIGAQLGLDSDAWVRGCAFADENRVVAAYRDGVLTCDLRKCDVPEARLAVNEVTALTLDGTRARRRLFVGTNEDCVLALDARPQGALRVEATFDTTRNCYAVYADGDKFVCASSDGAWIWPLETVAAACEANVAAGACDASSRPRGRQPATALAPALPAPRFSIPISSSEYVYSVSSSGVYACVGTSAHTLLVDLRGGADDASLHDIAGVTSEPAFWPAKASQPEDFVRARDGS